MLEKIVPKSFDDQRTNANTEPSRNDCTRVRRLRTRSPETRPKRIHCS
jgi:hypothetical protein